MKSNSMDPYRIRNGKTEDLYMPARAGSGLADLIQNGAGAQRNAVGRIFPNDEFESFRRMWRDGAPLLSLFADSPFDIRGRVARDGDNNRDDVAKVQTLLDRTNHFDLDALDGPTGYFTLSLDRALKDFQVDLGLAVDGAANPSGETMQAFRNAVAMESASIQPFKPWELSEPEIDEDTVPERVISMRPASPSIFPDKALTRSERDAFTARTGFGLESHDGRVTLLHPRTGRRIANLPESLAEELVAHWDEYSDRVQLLMLFDRRDISPAEKLRIADRLLKTVTREEYGADGSRVGIARGGANVQYASARDKVNTAWHAFQGEIMNR